MKTDCLVRVVVTIVLYLCRCCETRSTWNCPLMLESCELLSGIEGAKGIRGDPGLPGPIGTPGLPGNRGDRGDPGTSSGEGRIDIKGGKGDQGSPGRKGLHGPRGPRGRLGDRGDIGRPGRKGFRGRQGNAGFPGSLGSKGDGDSNVNWKQCTFTLDVNKQNGEIHACTFQKSLGNTALHVTYQGDTHVGLCGTCCKKWEFLFNGQPCSSPGSIDAVYDSLMLVNNNKPSVLPVFWHGSISGYCSNQPSGPVRVAIAIKNCSDSPNDSVHVNTQVTITGRIIIREVPPPQQ